MRFAFFFLSIISLFSCDKVAQCEEVINPAPVLSVNFSNFTDSANISLKKNNSERIDYDAFVGEGIASIRAEAVYKDVFDEKKEVFKKTMGFNSTARDVSVFNFTSPTNNEVILTIIVTDVRGQTAIKILTINKNIHNRILLL